MHSNLEKYKGDLKKLIENGELLLLALQYEWYPTDVEKKFDQAGKKHVFIKLKKELPLFKSEYQSWYSETRAVIKQLLSDRLTDFVRHYDKPKSRKEITFANYVIEDYLEGLRVTRFTGEVVVNGSAAISHFEQQLSMLKSVQRRFESSLFDIQQLSGQICLIPSLRRPENF